MPISIRHSEKSKLKGTTDMQEKNLIIEGVKCEKVRVRAGEDDVGCEEV